MPGSPRRPVMVRNPDGTTVFVDPDSLPAGENPPELPAGESPPAGENPPEPPVGRDLPTLLPTDAEFADIQEQQGLLDAQQEAEAADIARRVELNATRLSPQERANTAQMATGPGGQPVFVDPGQGPLSEAALQQGVGGPDGLQPNELSSTGIPSQIAQQPLVPDPRAQMQQFLGERGLSQAARPSVSRSSGGAPVVAPTTEPRPPLTEEQRKALTAGEQLAWDDPGVGDAEMTRLMETSANNISHMGQTTQSAQEEIAAARAAHEQQLNESATQIRETMEETIAETQRMQDDMQSRVDSLYSERFDPRRVFSSPDAAASFSLHTGYAMGAMLQSLQATNFAGSNPVNVASRVIDQVIEADIARQRESFRRGEGEIRHGFAAIEARQRLGVSEVDALQFSRSAAEEEVAQQMSRIAAQYQGTHAGEVAKQAANQYRLAAMGRRRALNETALALASQQALSNVRGRRAAAPATEDGRVPAPLSVNPIPADRRTPEQEARFQALAGSRSAQTNFLQVTTAGENITRTAGAILRRLREGGTVVTSHELIGSLRSLEGMLGGNIKDALGLGAYDDGVKDLIARIAGSPGDRTQWTNQTLAQMRQLASTFRIQTTALAEANGYTFDPSRIDAGPADIGTLMDGHTESQGGEGQGASQAARIAHQATLPTSPGSTAITTPGTVMDTVARRGGNVVTSVLRSLFTPSESAPEAPEAPDDDTPLTVGDLFGR